jgi:hypothetical protein
MQVPESVSTPASPDPSTLGPSLSTSTFGPSLDPSTVVPAASDVLEASALPLPVTLPPQPHARKMHVATRCPRKQSRSTQGACAMDQPTTSAGLPPRPRPRVLGRRLWVPWSRRRHHKIGCPRVLRRASSEARTDPNMYKSHNLTKSQIWLPFSVMPLRAPEARKYIRRLLEEGIFVVRDHARREMKKDNLNDSDAINIVRGGVVREPEWENGSWRYHVDTPRMCFVVAFDPEPDALPDEKADLSEVELVVVTAWRIRS